MGADLYIKKMDREAQYRGFDVSDEAVAAGYFRDPYNGGGLFAVMSANLGKSFSWWELAARNDLDFSKRDNALSVKSVKKLRDELALDIERFTKLKKLKYGYGSEKQVPAKEVKEYHRWARSLLTFLDLAIEKKSPVIFSV